MHLLQSVMMLGCVAIGGALLLGSLSEVRHASLLWRARRCTAGSIARTAATVVDVRGQVHLDQTLTAPLSGLSCAQWLVVVSRAPPGPGQERDGQSDALVFQDARPFWVDDGTGRVRVDVKGRSIPLSEVSSKSTRLERLTAPLAALITARLGSPAAAWCHRRDVTVVESALFAYDEVSLVARCSTFPRLAIDPVHVTRGRPRVVALRRALRAVVTTGMAVVFFAIAKWLR